MIKQIMILAIMLNGCGNSVENINGQIKINTMDGNIEEKVRKAPELRVDRWIDGEGKETSPIKLSQYKDKFKVIYCFQHWCPGCHSQGLPALQKLTKAFENNDGISFFAVQTVFEGSEVNTYERILETQQKYDLNIPFGHDPGERRSTIMEDYKTGGTPWFILIDRDDNVIFADFHINVQGAIDYLNEKMDK